ncbi:carboxypeptidase M32 [Yoonia sp. 208BN28-4]|uniref:carboxypeptidase M32 n=1 Tax=Yoonia sp. 208BN28-4 TaxID=3126505 RepID=UPI0030B52457
MSAFDDLMQFQRETEALGQIAGRLGWDQETMMPDGAAPQRAEEHAAMSRVLHARRIDPRVGEWLEKATPVTETDAAQLRHIRRNFEKTAKVPADLAAAIAKTTSLAHRTWAKARAEEDVAAFLPVLSQVVDLMRKKAVAVSDGANSYDALLDDYEPGMTGETLAAMFDALRPRLVALREAILSKPAPAALSQAFDEAGQLALSQKLAKAFGYDTDHGRIDKAVHPFSSGSGLDVRITTRTNPLDPFNCFYSTIHEVGHACYEQGIDRDYLLSPLGSGVSMGVHESQSRIYENQLGRSRAFTGWLFGQMRDQFGDFGIADEDAFYATVNRVSDGFIRTEADEVQYNLHVLLRFDLERALMAGDLAVSDLEAAWNDRFKADFGYAVDMPSNGVLQDVHWSEGLFGYFPTYTLGNVYAGCLNTAMRSAVPSVDADLARGDATTATQWLRENVQRHGGLRTPQDTIIHATGAAPTEAPLLDYLETKFGDIYGL